LSSDWAAELKEGRIKEKGTRVLRRSGKDLLKAG
jgi:hypothetical protein